MKHYMMDLLIGALVGAVFFVLLVFWGYDSVFVETIGALLVFLGSTQIPHYKKKHSVKPKDVFIAFLWYVLGISAAYFILWVFLAVAATLVAGPSFSA